MESDTVKINNEQQAYYQGEEQNRMNAYRELYAEIIENIRRKKNASVLDIGGGAGFFARWLKGEILRDGMTDIRLKIVVLDSVRYGTWRTTDGCIEYVQADAVQLDHIFEEKSFDYIFCNMFVHHIIGKNFRESGRIRKKVFSDLKKLLKPGGRVLITDNMNDGFLFDESSCRILFALTTCKNPVIMRVSSHFGSHSAGSGVCMMSQKMWKRLLVETGFRIEQIKLTKPDSWKLIRKTVLMNKEYRQAVLIVAR
ncbi:MAG: class I SAM-dependent methyltransferase [Roseburia sp.]|nr:class I SAM-dependent methyltransferase [Roseburia sp.]MCM1202059.1 class I SAM-dependent methyltransferase [Bacteroides fragilis]